MQYTPSIPDFRRTAVHAAAHDVRSGHDDATPRFDFLEDATRELAHSFLQSTLATAAELALPLLGTWCAVDIVENDRSIRRIAIIHPNADCRDRARAHYATHAPAADEPIGAPRLLASGSEPVIALGDDALESYAPHETRDLLRSLGDNAFILVAMRHGDRTLGAITFGSDVHRQFDIADMLLAEELGRRCALTVDSARSYAETQMARVRAEHAFAMQDAARAEQAFAANRPHRASAC